MANIAVTPEQLRSVGTQLNAVAANIESTLSQLTSHVAPLQSEWQGVAQARVQKLWGEWQRSSRGIQDALQGISQITQQIGANYESTEQQIAGSFGRYWSGGPDRQQLPLAKLGQASASTRVSRPMRSCASSPCARAPYVLRKAGRTLELSPQGGGAAIARARRKARGRVAIERPDGKEVASFKATSLSGEVEDGASGEEVALLLLLLLGSTEASVLERRVPLPFSPFAVAMVLP